MEFFCIILHVTCYTWGVKKGYTFYSDLWENGSRYRDGTFLLNLPLLIYLFQREFGVYMDDPFLMGSNWKLWGWVNFRVKSRDKLPFDFDDLLKTDGLLLMPCDNSTDSWSSINLMGVWGVQKRLHAVHWLFGALWGSNGATRRTMNITIS